MPPKDLPCAHCGVPIPMVLRQFFPSRRFPIFCPSCGQLSRLAWSTVLFGLGALMTLAVAGLILLDKTGLPKADTIPTILLLGAAFLGVSAVATHIACRVCRSHAQRLDPCPPTRRRSAR